MKERTSSTASRSLRLSSSENCLASSKMGRMDVSIVRMVLMALRRAGRSLRAPGDRFVFFCVPDELPLLGEDAC